MNSSLYWFVGGVILAVAGIYCSSVRGAWSSSRRMKSVTDLPIWLVVILFLVFVPPAMYLGDRHEYLPKDRTEWSEIGNSWGNDLNAVIKFARDLLSRNN